MVDLSAAEAPLVLSLDIGSSSVRAAAYDARGRRVNGSAAQVTYRLATTPDGGVEVDATALFERLCAAVDAALHRLAGRAHEIAGVGTSVFVSSVVGLDGDGNPLSPLYTYADTRNAPDSAALRCDWDVDDIYDRTGCPIHASYLPARIRWLRRVAPAQFSLTDRWVSFGEFVFARIFGRSEGLGLSVAAWTGLLNRRTLDWDEKVLELLRLNRRRLGSIDARGDPVIGLAQPWARRWPALAAVPWLPPLGDGLCSNLGTAPRVDAAVVMNLGTSAAVRTLVRGPRRTVPRGLWEYRVTEELSLLGGALSNGGNVAVWMRETLTQPADGEIDQIVGAVPPDGHGLTVLPFFAGERSPGWNDAARATIHGLGLHTRPVEILRAGMESVAYRLATVYELLQPAVKGVHSIAISGGGFRQSAVWSQIVADVLGRPVLRSAAREATSRGAAIWALRALDIVDAWEAVEPPGGELIQPDRTAHRRYRSARARQQDLYQRLARPDAPQA